MTGVAYSKIRLTADGANPDARTLGFVVRITCGAGSLFLWESIDGSLRGSGSDVETIHSFAKGSKLDGEKPGVIYESQVVGGNR